MYGDDSSHGGSSSRGQGSYGAAMGQGPRQGQGSWGQSYGGGGFAGTGQGLHRGRGPRSYKRSDERIKEDICDRLTDDPDASMIEVQVTEGDVILSGSVSDRQSKRRAEDVAEEISGIRNVQNNLRIESAGYESGQSSGSYPATGSGSSSSRSSTGSSTGTSGTAGSSYSAGGSRGEGRSGESSKSRSTS